MQKRSKLNVYLPFVFSRENDPTSIFTVGDQVLAEHLYSFHARSTIKHGFENFASIVEIDADTDTVHITPKFDISRANGTRLSSESFCRSIKRSMEGTLHAPYRSLVRSVECNEKKFSIQYKRLPANLRSLFTLPDFSVFDVDSLPLTSKNGKESTGPYYLELLKTDMAVLRRNPYYPSTFFANNLDTVIFQSYQSSETQTVIRDLESGHYDVVYFFGHSLSRSDIEFFEEQKYLTEISPMEWVTFIIMKPTADDDIKLELANIVEQFSQDTDLGLGVQANSISPSDRKSALTNTELFEIRKAWKKSAAPVQKSYTAATLSSWEKVPHFSKLISRLKNRIPNLKISYLERADMKRLYSSEFDFSLAMLGISPTDPLSHFSFLTNMNKDISSLVSDADIANAAILSDPEEFVSTIKSFESKLAKSGIIIPIGHFPGVTVRKSDLEVDHNLSFGWGIQAWSIRGH